MTKPKEKNSYQSSEAIAQNSYQPSDYQSSEEVEQGLAATHEQVSDVYMEGTVDRAIPEKRGKSNEPEEGFES
ncbi:YozQ family protein [Halalkalibacter kiskunsagensis]|uniref:YozQ family protein n=1 Tax=Halalkalibacter kiskunsagensis TaxID=1548599 RepID=A0ABV6KEY3_9BACI